MRILRTLVLAAAAALPLAAPALDARPAQASGPQAHRHVAVYYRSGPRFAWQLYGHFPSPQAAEQAVRHLERQGYQVYTSPR